MPLSDYEQRVLAAIERMLGPTGRRLDKLVVNHQRRARWGGPIRTGALLAGVGLMFVGVAMISAVGEAITTIGFALLVAASVATVHTSIRRRLPAIDHGRASLARHLRQYLAPRRWPPA